MSQANIKSQASRFGGHPLLDEIIAGLRKDGDGHYFFGKGFLAPYLQRAERIQGGRELYQLVGDLVRLAALMRHESAAVGTVEALLEMSDKLTPRLGTLAEQDGVAAGKKSARAAGQADKQQRKMKATRNPAAGIAPGSQGVGLRSRKKK